jgi:hypothetical protein
MNEKFESALAADWPKIAAWDLHREGDLRFLSVFSREGKGAKHVCGISVGVDEVEALTRRLEQAGIQIGIHDRWVPFVWWVSDEEIIVWDQERILLHAHDETIELIHDIVVNPADIERVFSFADSTRISRGVRSFLKNGKQAMLVFHLSADAKYDPTYNRNQLIVETAWAGVLGQEIAQWIGVPYERRI